ncbi:MAG: ABC transporter ATP-binding protein [Phycisphaerales bacterium]
MPTPDPATARPVIELQNVQRAYHMGSQVVHALAGVSHVFREGSFWAIMGPSGSGKSTMLNMLGCLDRPTAGQYILDGYDVSSMSDDDLSAVRLQRIGFIFQSFNLIAQLTVRENIELPMYYLGVDVHEAAARAEKSAELVGLEHRLDHRPSELSGGQQQRVAIARSLVNDPTILLADEPTGNLDSATGEQIMTLLTELNRQGRTVIMVTHEPDIAAHAHHQLHMRDGRIERIEGK